MYAGTIFTIDDQSDIVSLPISETVVDPIQFMGFTADKGTEDYIYVQGNDFFKHYGTDISFDRHGQPLLQAANVINNGGKLFCKRVVASDSMLANAGILTTLATVEKQRTVTDTESEDYGKKLCWNTTGDAQVPEDDPTADPTKPVMNKYVTVSNDIKTFSNLGNDVAAGAKGFVESITDPTKEFATLFMCETGRGVSTKRVTIVPDYSLSRSYEYMKYRISVFDGNDQVSSLVATLNPYIIEGESNIGIDNVVKNTGVPQIRTKFTEVQFDKLVAALKDLMILVLKNNIPINDPTITDPDVIEEMATAEVEAMNLEYQDLFYCANYKGLPISEWLELAATTTAMTSEYGVDLENGSNGNFGDKPWDETKRITYETEMVKVFDGTFDDCIYDVNNNPMNLVVDANYPIEVKKAIVKFASFREDICYLMDVCNYDETTHINSPCKSVLELKNIINLFSSTKTRYTIPYCTWYDIMDPYTRKQITVSIGYSLARLCVKHFTNGRNRPLAGLKYGIVIPEAIEGTVNFVPKITPDANQKEQLAELRINYACFLQGQFVIETEYTFQDKYTDLSFANNVFAIQEVIQAIRAKCPIVRYTFTDGKDFEDYKIAVQAVLNNYSGNFYSLTMEYVEDAAYINNKIFYAVIKVQFRQFVQTEMFKITALPYVMA